MSEEQKVDAAADPDKAGAEAHSEPQPATRGFVRRMFDSFWEKVLAVGFLLWAAVIFLALWFSGAIDLIRQETGGVVHIESPQIYTRERLVNDRFREQAWLEAQLAELESRAATISSYRKDSFRLNVGKAETAADDAAADAPGATTEDLEEKLLVSADDSFNLQRNMRATIRRALIENELDDRHDLGSNSLYQFNFGAAIIAGPRTRRIAAIEMELEPVDPLRPLGGLIDDDGARCDGLLEFECAYLFKANILEDPGDAEAGYVREYDRWESLFLKWLGSENAAFRREADDIRDLLRSQEARPRIATLLKPFFDNLNVLAGQYRDAFNAVSDDAEDLSQSDCYFDETTGGSIESQLSAFIHTCVDTTNKRLAEVGSNVESITGFFNQNVLKVDEIEANRFPDDRGTQYWDQFFRRNFDRFNDQCAWGGEFVEPVGDGAPSYKLRATVAPDLLDCIARSVVRDYGSHPFRDVERADVSGSADFGGDPAPRGSISAYHARKGLSSIIVTSKQLTFRSRTRRQYVGVVARPTNRSEMTALTRYPYGLATIDRTCRHYPASPGESGGDGPIMTFGVSSVPYFREFSLSSVDGDIGWNLLTHLICDTYARAIAPPDDPYLIDNAYNLPIGLFRFISLLSDSQRTFSYSVQPSGSFSLQQRSSTSAWDWTSLLTGQPTRSQIAAGGDTTESWIEKQYRIIGFGAQVDQALNGDSGGDAIGARDRRAKFGWYVFPANTHGRLFGAPVMDSANVKLSALVSLPAWWENVDIKITASWRDPNAPNTVKVLEGEEKPVVRELRVELPTRLEFIRNHFPNTATIRPSLYRLHIPQLTLRACEEANIVLKGERLWRSTVVTLGAQKSTLIQVMPDMRGIIAHFGKVIPVGVPENTEDPVGIPVTVWTSEGQKSVVDTVSIRSSDDVLKRIRDGLSPCPDETANPGGTEKPDSE